MSDEEKVGSDPLIGTIMHGGFVSEQPPDVDDFLSEIGLTEKAYVFTIKRAPREGSASKEFLPVNLKGTYLPIEDCGKRFGPGKYYYCFSWTGRNPEEPKKPLKVFKEYQIYLGSEWDEVYDIYMAEKYVKGQKNLETMAYKKKMQDAAKGILPNETTSQAVDPVENLKNSMTMLKDLGVPIGGAPATTENSNMQMMGLMMTMQQKASDQAQESNKNTMAMFMTMNQNMMTMMMGVMNNNKPQTNDSVFKEVLNMVNNAVDLKNVLNPAQETMVDKIFGLATSVLPAIIAIAKKPPAAKENDPMLNMIKESDDFAAIRENPEMLKALIKKWDVAHGVEQTNIILESVNLTRPGAPMKTEQDPPVQNDPDLDAMQTNDDPDLDSVQTNDVVLSEGHVPENSDEHLNPME